MRLKHIEGSNILPCKANALQSQYAVSAYVLLICTQLLALIIATRLLVGTPDTKRSSAVSRGGEDSVN